MHQVEVIAEDQLPEGVDWAMVETCDGDVVGFVKKSRLLRLGLPQQLRNAVT